MSKRSVWLGFGSLIAAVLVLPTSGWAHSPEVYSSPTPSANVVREAGEISLPIRLEGHSMSAAEEWLPFNGERAVHNVAQPTLTPFLPDPDKANGTAVIVAPGGGFMWLSVDSEGYSVARWLASKGVAAFVLKYRLVPTPATKEGMLGYVGTIRAGGPEALGEVLKRGEPIAIADAAEAMRMVRRRAAEWKIDPQKVGFLGFSAGAITTLGIATQPDDTVRPDFIAPIYGPMTKPVGELPATLPPMWVALSGDDDLFGKSDMGLVAAWQERKAPVEFHLYERGGHGWGFAGAANTTTHQWPSQFEAWLRMRGLLAGH